MNFTNKAKIFQTTSLKSPISVIQKHPEKMVLPSQQEIITTAELI